MKKEKNNLNKIDNILGDKEKVKDIIYGLKVLVKQNKQNSAEFSKLLEDTKNLSLTNDSLRALGEVLDNIKNNTLDTDKKEYKTRVLGLPSIFKVKVTNPVQQKDIQEVSFAKPKWYQEINLSFISESITKALSKILNVKVSNQDPNDAIPVKLVDNGKFYRAGGNSANGVISTFKENGQSTECELIDGNVPIDVKNSVLPTGAATSANQKDGSQKTQVVDEENNNIDFSTSEKQDVTNEKIDDINSNLDSIETKQDTTNEHLTDIKTELITNNVFLNYGLYAVDSDDATYFYSMYQNQLGAWIILRITLIGGITLYSKGTTDASTNWTGRASLTYTDFATTFA